MMNTGIKATLSEVEEVSAGPKLLAIIVRADYQGDGICFFTPHAFSQQLAHMRRPAGYVIEPHVHNEVIREVQFTREVLFVRRGRLRVDFYTESHDYVESRVLGPGDVVLLAAGGHGFEMLEETEIIEVKQGPYTGDGDKSAFEPTMPEHLRIR